LPFASQHKVSTTLADSVSRSVITLPVYGNKISDSAQPLVGVALSEERFCDDAQWFSH